MRSCFKQAKARYEYDKKEFEKGLKEHEKNFEELRLAMSQEVMKANSPEDLAEIGKKIQAWGKNLIKERTGVESISRGYNTPNFKKIPKYSIAEQANLAAKKDAIEAGKILEKMKNEE